MIQLLLTVLGVATFIIGSFWLASFITFRDRYKYYKQTYLAIKDKEYLFYSKEGDIRFRHKEDIDDTFNRGLYFTKEIILYDDGTIKLLDGVYLHKSVGFDPYSLYWFYKIKKEMMFNSMSVVEKRDYKLKQLLK